MNAADRPGRRAIPGQGPREASSATSSRSRWPPPSFARRCTRTRSSTSCSRRPRSATARRPAPSSRPISSRGRPCPRSWLRPRSCPRRRRAEGEEGRCEGKAKAAARAAAGRARQGRGRKGVEQAEARQAAQGRGAGQGPRRPRPKPSPAAKKAPAKKPPRRLERARDRLRRTSNLAIDDLRGARASGSTSSTRPTTRISAVLSRDGEPCPPDHAAGRPRPPDGCRRSSPSSS